MSQLDEVARSAEQNAQHLIKEKEGLLDELNESERKWAEACLRLGRRVTIFLKATLTVVIALLATAASVLEDNDPGFLALVGTLAFLSTAGAGLLGNRLWPTNPLERWISKRRDAAVSKFATLHNIEHIIAKFRFDWQRFTVNRKN